ncbi:hypothetical protein [Rhizobium grahamii]|nr:hypothetical protein [Rhizobium grahamii]
MIDIKQQELDKRFVQGVLATEAAVLKRPFFGRRTIPISYDVIEKR